MKLIAATAAVLIALAITGNATSAFAAKPIAVSAAPALTIRFTGIEAPTGAVMLSLFASEAAFDAGGKPVALLMAPVKGDSAEAVFSGLAPGRNAVKAYGTGGRGSTTPMISAHASLSRSSCRCPAARAHY